MDSSLRAWVSLVGASLVGAAVAGCTEPNPYLPAFDTGEPASTGTTDAGPEPTTGSTTDVVDGSSGSGGGSACAEAGGECVEPAPEGWSGPFAWMERSTSLEPAPCPAPWDQPSTEAFSDISAPAARCSCECGDLLGASCGPVTIEHHEQPDCTGTLLHSIELTEPTCEGLEPPFGWGSGGGYSFAAPAVVGGTCIPSAQTEVQEPSFLTRHQACGGSLESMGCGDARLCAPVRPDPLDPRLCVWSEGDVPCPEGSAYSEHRRLFRSLDDDRGCEPCSCTPPRGSCAGASLGLSNGSPCGPPIGVAVADACSEGPGAAVLSLIYMEGELPGACEPAIVVPTGEASGAEPVSFCCTPSSE